MATRVDQGHRDRTKCSHHKGILYHSSTSNIKHGICVKVREEGEEEEKEKGWVKVVNICTRYWAVEGGLGSLTYVPDNELYVPQ